MCSRFIFGLSLSLVMLFTSGCDRFLKRNDEIKNDAESVKIEFKDGECLKDVPAQLQKFLADEDGLRSSFACVQSALKSFMRLTRGAQPDLYQAKELQNFFNTYLLKENKISNEFQDDVMKIKVAVVGGHLESVTRTEMEKFIEFLAQLEIELSRFQGKMRLLGFKADRGKVQITEIDALKKDVIQMVDFILKSSKMVSSQYQWSDFLTFVGHLHEFFGEQKDLDQLLKWLPLIDSGKVLFLGDNSKLLTLKDWNQVKSWLIGTYITVLRFHYQIREVSFREPSEWVTLLSWLDEAIATLETAPVMKEKKTFDANAIDKAIDEVLKTNIFETRLSSELIKQTYRKALAYFVEPNSAKSDPLKIKGLTEEHFKALKNEYNIWKAAQIFLSRTYLAHSNQSLATLKDHFAQFSTNPENWNGFPAVGSQDLPEYEQAWKDFFELFAAKNPLVFTSQLKLQVGYPNPNIATPFTGMNLLNGIRMLSRLALKGYGDKENALVFKRRISKKRMIDMEENFREFGRAIGFFDPDKTTAGKDTFDQANLLVADGNGDTWVDSRELTQVLSSLISGGKFMLDEIYLDLEKRNCLKQEQDVFRRPWVDEACFLKVARIELRSYLNNLPESIRFLNSLNDEQFLQAFRSMMKVATSPRHRPGLLESSEIRAISTILHFVEAIVAICDRNGNHVLGQSEVLAAFPRFEKIIEEQARKESIFAGLFLDDIFLYLVYEGKKPSGTLAIIQMNVKKNLGTLGEVDKLMILRLIGVMKEFLSNAPSK